MGLGEDEDKESEAAAELECMKVDKEFRRMQQQRKKKKERELIHAEKEIEQQRIHDKYQLPDHSKKSKGWAYTSSQGAKDKSQFKVRP